MDEEEEDDEEDEEEEESKLSFSGTPIYCNPSSSRQG